MGLLSLSPYRKDVAKGKLFSFIGEGGGFQSANICCEPTLRSIRY